MDYDLIVLGGGSGGIAACQRAAKYGARVLLIEASHLGGTCVNLGCVPKKVMYNASMMAESVRKSWDYGFTKSPVSLDWSLLVCKRNDYILKLRDNYARKLEQSKISLVRGKGIFIDANTIAVGEQRFQAKHILIATGGEPRMPHDLPGINHALDSDGFFALTAQPKKVAIVGGGYIGVELAGLLHSLGTSTHLFLSGEYPLSRFDPMLGQTLSELMHQQGITLYPKHQVQQIEIQDNGKKTIRCGSNAMLPEVDAVIVAIGRIPRTRGLNLESIGLDMDKQGIINIDAYQNTSVPGIYAIGDVTSLPALTPVAIAAGRKLADRLFGGLKNAHVNRENICSVIFTHPPIGSVGLSEQEALNKFGNKAITIYKTSFTPMLDALSEHKTPTVMKVITQGKDEKIIGLHIIGHGADEMLQGFGVAMTMGACKKDFEDTIAIHPTSSEELLTIVNLMGKKA